MVSSILRTTGGPVGTFFEFWELPTQTGELQTAVKEEAQRAFRSQLMPNVALAAAGKLLYNISDRTVRQRSFQHRGPIDPWDLRTTSCSNILRTQPIIKASSF